MGKCMLIGAECPKTSDPNAKRYCPMWDDNPMIWENNATGEQKVFHCSAQMSMLVQKEVIAASNRPAAAVESTRNTIEREFSKINSNLKQISLGRRLAHDSHDD